MSTFDFCSTFFLFFFSFFLLLFIFHEWIFHEMFKMSSTSQFPKIYDALLKPNLKTSLKQFFKGVVHEQPRYTIVWFVWGVHYCFQLLSWGHDFFVFLIAFSFYFLFSMIDILKFSEMFKMPSKEKKKYTIVWFVWGYTIVSSCFPEVMIFFPSFPLPFPLLYFSFNYLITFLVSFIWNSLEIFRNAQFPKIYDALLKPN